MASGPRSRARWTVRSVAPHARMLESCAGRGCGVPSIRRHAPGCGLTEQPASGYSTPIKCRRDRHSVRLEDDRSGASAREAKARGGLRPAGTEWAG